MKRHGASWMEPPGDPCGHLSKEKPHVTKHVLRWVRLRFIHSTENPKLFHGTHSGPQSSRGPFRPHSTQKGVDPRLCTFTVLNDTGAKSLQGRESGGTNIHPRSARQRLFPEDARRHFIQKALHAQTRSMGAVCPGPCPQNIFVCLPPSLVTWTFLF